MPLPPFCLKKSVTSRKAPISDLIERPVKHISVRNLYFLNYFQDEEILPPDEKITISDNRPTKSTVTSTLKIASMSEELAGKYECRVISNGKMRNKFYTLALKGK